MKAIHIHTDHKFISNTNRFEGNYFENVIVIIGNVNDYEGPFKKSARLFDKSPKSVHKIIKLCAGADLVVLYDLDYMKCRIALGLPKKMPIAWRFFGHELYGRESQYYSTDLTKQAKLLNKVQKKLTMMNIGNLIKARLNRGLFSRINFSEVVKRIDFFLCLSQEEYDHLLTRWPDLPVFLRFPISPYHDTVNEFFVKKKIIIIGNNRSYFNNHLDIIEVIEASEKRDQYQFVLLFNYGPETNYSNKVRNATSGKQYYKIIDNFMPLSEFKGLYKNVSAVVFNGYRQMAMANIFTAFQKGVKVYLNKKNITMQWLLNEGFIIYSIDDFAQDLENGNIILTEDAAKHNSEQLHKMTETYTFENFQNKFLTLIKKNQQD